MRMFTHSETAAEQAACTLSQPRPGGPFTYYVTIRPWESPPDRRRRYYIQRRGELTPDDVVLIAYRNGFAKPEDNYGDEQL